MGVSRAGERGKAEESEGERAGECCAGTGELDIAGEDVKGARGESAGWDIRTGSGIRGSSMQRLAVLGRLVGARGGQILRGYEVLLAL